MIKKLAIALAIAIATVMAIAAEATEDNPIETLDTGQVGTPVVVRLLVEQGETYLWNDIALREGDAQWITAFDSDGNQLNVYWSPQCPSGIVIFELVIGKVAPEGGNVILTRHTHTLKYTGTIPVPDPLKELVRPLIAAAAALSVTDEHSAYLSVFYADFATAIGSSAADSMTTEQFRNAYIKAGTIVFAETGIKGKYDGIAEITDDILAQQLGLENVPLDKAKAIAILNTISWAWKQ